MKGIVWYKNRSCGEEKINEIINRYDLMGIGIIKKINSKNNSLIIFGNGDTWRLMAVADNVIGQKCNISLIEQSIEKDFIDTIIKPCTIASPFTAYNYY